jgi:hypothetical protein
MIKRGLVVAMLVAFPLPHLYYTLRTKPNNP